MQHAIRGSLTTVTAALVLVMLMVLVSMAATYHARTAASHPATNSNPALKAIGDFEATVYSGPDKGLSLKGVLKLKWTKVGQLTGMLVPKTGTAVPVTGLLRGAAINLVFYFGGGKHVFGVGTVGKDPGATRYFAGGPLVGPSKGDSGDWDLSDNTLGTIGDFFKQLVDKIFG